ncbi:MAG: signal recognition particle-docking protein FtsY [Ruminococcaceae bacterium]|nr:signal recognition particle-docking protein FtsY [Oscillospiraceae bacterium]
MPRNQENTLRTESERNMGFFEKLKQGLAKTKNAILHRADSLFRALSGEIDEDFYEELEEILILADFGAETAMEIIDQLRDKITEERIMKGEEAKLALREILVSLLEKDGLELNLSTKPSSILMIGVNGVGKTTSIAKIANYLKQDGKSVLLAAGDTFRAAAREQLGIWADRVGVDMISQGDGADPAAVVFDAAAAAKKRGADVLIVDTAGRLHNKKNLMNELHKISGVLDRELPGCDREMLLVLDATTGQNAVSQAKEFKNSAGITGLVLTKLDGTAKGGIVFSLKKELGVPVKFIGVGEGMDDLRPFDPEEFVNALFE